MHLTLRPHRSGILCIIHAAFCLFLVPSSPVWAKVSLTLATGVKNPPDPRMSDRGEWGEADTISLMSAQAFNPILTALLTASGYTAEHNWVYSSDPAVLPEVLNPYPLLSSTEFNITRYSIGLNPAGTPGYPDARTAFNERLAFTLLNPPNDPLGGGGGGVTVTQHWLQIVNRDPGGHVGHALAGLPGGWFFDNGLFDWEAGVGPFMDSSGPVGDLPVPPDFVDDPKWFSKIGTYVHFITFPAWDIYTGGKDYLIVGDTGIQWGLAIVADPPSGLLIGVPLCLVVLAVRFCRGVKYRTFRA